MFGKRISTELTAGKGWSWNPVPPSHHEQMIANPSEQAPEETWLAQGGKSQTLAHQHPGDKDFLQTAFTIEAPGAKSVYVTGSFNDWSLDDSCRLYEVDGKWETSIPLKRGVYKYQFIVDGVWKEDPKNPNKERNSFGDINSLVEVKTNE